MCVCPFLDVSDLEGCCVLYFFFVVRCVCVCVLCVVCIQIPRQEECKSRLDGFAVEDFILRRRARDKLPVMEVPHRSSQNSLQNDYRALHFSDPGHSVIALQ